MECPSTTIELGSDEAAYYLRDCNNAIRFLAAYDFETSGIQRMPQSFKTKRGLFEHFKQTHYHLEREQHTRLENFIYAILQELVVFEANKTGRKPSKTEKRSLAIHALMKHLGLTSMDKLDSKRFFSANWSFSIRGL